MDYNTQVDSRTAAVNSIVKDRNSFHIKIGTSTTYTTVANKRHKVQALKPKVIQQLPHQPFNYRFDYSLPFFSIL